MQRPFGELNELLDIVVAQAGAQAHGERLHLERGQFLLPDTRSEPHPKGLVNNLFEGLTGTANLGTQFGYHIIVEGQCCSHIMMLN